MTGSDLHFRSFHQFWPFYVSQHKNKINRVLHVVGTLSGLSLAVLLFLMGKGWAAVILCPMLGYGCAWMGHFCFEKNRPATFHFPIYSFMGDLKMVYCLIAGHDLIPGESKKIICITGAGRGIGLGLVRHFLNQGHQVFAAVRSTNPALEELRQKQGLNLHVLEMDVTNEEQITQVANKIALKLGNEKLILINNAGISGGGPFEMMTNQHWQDMFNVNVMGLVNVTRAFLPSIRKTQGRIINIGSISGRVASPFMCSYSSSKYAVRAISDGLRRELGPLGISVVLIEPGPVATDIWTTSMTNSLKMMDQASMETFKLYQKNIDKLKTEIQNIESSSVSVEYLTTFVDEAMNAPQPKPYYRVGKRVNLIFILTHFLPARILDRLLGGGLRFEKMK